MVRSIGAAWALVAAAATPAASPLPAIEQAITASAAGWNAGDLDRFVAVYADDAIFVTPAGLVRGRAAIADHYRASFAGAHGNTRGRLAFTTLGYRVLSPVHVILFARWRLTPAAGAGEAGMTTLVFERRPRGWQIVSDHSSGGTPAAPATPRYCDPGPCRRQPPPLLPIKPPPSRAPLTAATPR